MIEKRQSNLSRREFLKSFWKYLGVLAILEAILMSLSLMRTKSSKETVTGKSLKSAGYLADIPPGTVRPFRSGRFFLIRLDDGGLIAVSMICSHLGCTVNWDSSENVFKCPCHSSSFDKLGNVIKSPATKALNYHKVIVRDGQVMVDLDNFLVRKKFDSSVVTYI